MRTTKILMLSRKRITGYNSIEEIFDSLKDLKQKVHYKEVPYKQVSFIKIMRNILFSWREKGDVSHIIGDIHYASIGTGKRTVLTIHDIGSTLKGNVIKKMVLKLFWYWLPAIIVSKITVISNFTAKELLKIIPFAKNKISVVYNPYNDRIKYSPKIFNIQKPVILHIGTKENKNLLRVIKALVNINCHLIIVGKLSKEHYIALNNNNISFSNFFNIPYDDIVKLYHESDIISFPSLYEGFGMPILEANKAGRPVITSNICSMPEIAGDAACFVDPFDIKSINRGFLEVIYDENYREKLIQNGLKNIERFTPEKITDEYFKIYEKILNG